MDNETLHALAPHSLAEWFFRVALIGGIAWLFLLGRYVYLILKGQNSESALKTMGEWLPYTVIYIVMAIASYFWGVAGFWISLVLCCFAVGYRESLWRAWKRIPFGVRDRLRVVAVILLVLAIVSSLYDCYGRIGGAH